MLKIGIIGAGRMGNNHANSIRILPDTEVTAVYDVKQEQLDAFLAKNPGVRVCASPEEVANSADVDFIVITSPTYCHIDGIRAAVATGKPIFCEKPLCRTQAQLAELTPIIRDYKNLFAIGFVRRYSQGVIKMRELLDSGVIGKILCFEVHVMLGCFKRMWGDWFADYSKCGGATLDMLAHHADLVNYFIGEAETVSAQALMENPDNGLPCDYVSATVKCRNGVIGNMQCSWLRSGRTGNAMTIYGENGTLELSDQTGVTLFTPDKSESIPLENVKVGNIPEGVPGMYAAEMAVLADCIRNGGKPYAGANEAIAAMKFCLAMMESAETGKLVHL